MGGINRGFHDFPPLRPPKADFLLLVANLRSLAEPIRLLVDASFLLVAFLEPSPR
jgi:hypothetical protein